MNKTLLLIIFLITSCSSTSQELSKIYYDYDGIKFLTQEGFLDKNKKKTKEWILYYKDFSDTTKTEKTQIKSITNYKNGLKDGLFQLFYLGGELKEEGNYRNNDKIGIWTNYYSNGNIKSILTHNDIYFASIKEYNKDGKLISETTYNDQTKVRISKTYNSNENISSISFKKKDSIGYKKFNDKGEVTEEKGSDGVRKKYLNGILSEIMSFKKGIKNGLFEVYDESGNIRVQGNYLDDKQDGVWKHFDEEKRLKELNTFENGILNGYSELYHHNGIIQKKGSYKNGKKDGEWKYYDIYGSEKTFIIYKDDKEVHSESVIRN